MYAISQFKLNDFQCDIGCIFSKCSMVIVVASELLERVQSFGNILGQEERRGERGMDDVKEY